MGRVERFQNVAAEDLPDVWRARLGLDANQRVNIRVEAVPTEDGSAIADPDLFERAISNAHSRVRWSEKTDEEIIGYDEFGLPT